MSFTELARAAMSEPPDRIVRDAAAKVPARLERVDWVISLSLGQVVDSSALAILRRETVTRNGRRQKQYDCPYLFRWPARTPYGAIVGDVARLFDEPHLHRQALVIDATGCGLGVLDLFRRAKVRGKIVPLTVTGGNTAATPDEMGGWRVPKRELVSSVRVVLGSTRIDSEDRLLKVNGKLELAAVLQRELETFTCKISLQANAPESWRDRPDDDLVLAVALGCWYGENAMCRFTMA
jgi:hypothetical protein